MNETLNREILETIENFLFIPFIALMSVVLLERTFSVENPKVVAMQRTDRIASASAMSGDLTNVWISDPREGDVRGGPEKIYPNSAVFLFEFQAPSVLQIIDTASSVLLDDCSGENRVPAGDKLDLLLFSCANDHSLDNLSPFSAVSSGVISLSSKTSVFLVVQMVPNRSTGGCWKWHLSVGGILLIGIWLLPLWKNSLQLCELLDVMEHNSRP